MTKQQLFQDKSVNIGDEVLKNLKKKQAIRLAFLLIRKKGIRQRGPIRKNIFAGIYLPKDFFPKIC